LCLFAHTSRVNVYGHFLQSTPGLRASGRPPLQDGPEAGSHPLYWTQKRIIGKRTR